MFYNNFLIATCGVMARHGTIGASINHYARWSEAYPLSEEDIAKMCNGKKREQEILIAGMLSKSHILDLLKNYVIYEVVENKKIKKIAKHQQYRVVTKAVDRLKLDEKDISDKGGVIWHTQGSGKSLSMLWFATQLMYKFENPPILIVTAWANRPTVRYGGRPSAASATAWSCRRPTARTEPASSRAAQRPFDFAGRASCPIPHSAPARGIARPRPSAQARYWSIRHRWPWRRACWLRD